VLEPDEGKLSSPVLRGLSGRKAARLPGEARTRERVRVTTMLCALSIKPLEGSRLRLRRTRSMGIQSIWSWKSLQRRELREKLGY
jgi:hypothetical protein